jgi:alkyl hydroperoxide reductase subunit F
MYDLIIIGGGPAGMTAAIYAAREKLNTLLITKEFGGQITKKEVAIENFPGFGKISAHDLVAKMEEHLKTFKVAIETAEVKAIDKTENGFTVRAGSKEFESRAVLLATGSDPRFLDVPGEKEMIGRGVGYCATCDGPLFSNRDVAVVGGGNNAFEAAIFLAGYAKKVYIIEYNLEVRADAENQERAARSGKVEVITNAQVLEIKGERFVSEIAYKDRASGQTARKPVEGVFVKVGMKPASALVAHLADLNDMGEVKYDAKTHQTRTPGLFAAGDVSEEKYKQFIVACGEGAKAAMAIGQYFRSKT